MRRHPMPWILVVLVAVALAGCGSRAEQAQQSTSADSLLASNPTEQQTGDLTPQSGYDQSQPPAETAPAPEPAAKPPARTTKKTTTRTAPPSEPASRSVSVPAGTAIGVTVNTAITSETAQPGDAWTGTVKDAVVLGTDAPIPAGSVVHGVVRGAVPAEKGSRAVLVLAITSIEVDGTSHAIDATADSMVAGSTRARNVGAVAGGAAAGALIGKAVGGGKGALIGGLLGGATATGVVAKTKGYQSVVKEGEAVTFHVDRDVTMKLTASR
jgi:hypothetical protein